MLTDVVVPLMRLLSHIALGRIRVGGQSSTSCLLFPMIALRGVHSTQRAEAVHSALAGRQLKNLSAVSVIDEMNAYNEHVQRKCAASWLREM